MRLKSECRSPAHARFAGLSRLPLWHLIRLYAAQNSASRPESRRNDVPRISGKSRTASRATRRGVSLGAGSCGRVCTDRAALRTMAGRVGPLGPMPIALSRRKRQRWIIARATGALKLAELVAFVHTARARSSTATGRSCSTRPAPRPASPPMPSACWSSTSRLPPPASAACATTPPSLQTTTPSTRSFSHTKRAWRLRDCRSSACSGDGLTRNDGSPRWVRPGGSSRAPGEIRLVN